MGSTKAKKPRTSRKSKAQRAAPNPWPETLSNLCPDCAGAPRANPARPCAWCGTQVCKHAVIMEAGQVKCLPCRSETDCGCGLGGGCGCLYLTGECQCDGRKQSASEPEPARAPRAFTANPGVATRPTRNEVREVAARIREEFGARADAWVLLLADIRDMARGGDPTAARDRDYEGWSDGDFEVLLAALGERA